MDLKEIGYDIVEWINLAQDRDKWQALVNTVMNLRVPQITRSSCDMYRSRVQVHRSHDVASI